MFRTDITISAGRFWYGRPAISQSSVLMLTLGFQIAAVEGGGLAGRDGAWTNVALDFPAGDRERIATDLVVTVGRRER